jgi:hypothetical protein
MLLSINSSHPYKLSQAAILTNYYCPSKQEIIFAGDNSDQIRVSGKNPWKGKYEAQCLFIAIAAWIAAVGIKEWPALMMKLLSAPNMGA